MSPPPLSPAAALVRQLDPDLFHTALFAPEPVREQLMALYAFDIELSKAAAKTAEPMIARMRLQWWRDLVTGIAAGEAPQKHEIAEPLHGLLSAHDVPGGDLAALIDAREVELEGPLEGEQFANWLDSRFGALTRLAVHLTAGESDAAHDAASAVGHAVGVAFVLRNAAPMAADNQYLLPGLGPEDRAELARGRTTGPARTLAHRLAGEALEQLTAARAGRQKVPKAAVPALLPVWRAERVLKRVQRPDADLGDLAGQGGRGVALAWRALRRQW